MGFSKLALTLAILSTICLSTSHLAHSQSFAEDCLRAHNAARKRVHVPPLRWSRPLAAIAQRYASLHVQNCRPIPPPPPPPLNGWNIYIGRRGTCSAAVASWVSERPYYNCTTNTCAAGRTCSHYTQVVRHTTRLLGCGRARCTNGNYFIACAYNPRGNPGQPAYPCRGNEALEAVEGAVEELVEETLEEAVEETLTEEVVAEEEEEVADVSEEINVIAEVV